MNETKFMPQGRTRFGILLIAVVSAPVMWCVGACLGQYFGKSPSQASSDAAAGALCGLAAWLGYHLISGQNNGLIIASMGIVPAMKGDRPFGSMVAILLPSLMLPAAIIGLIVRVVCVLKKKQLSQPPVEPLYDDQLDHAT